MPVLFHHSHSFTPLPNPRFLHPPSTTPSKRPHPSLHQTPHHHFSPHPLASRFGRCYQQLVPLHNMRGVYVRFSSLCAHTCVSQCFRERENVGKEWRLFSDGINCFFDPVISGRRHSEGAGDEAPMAEFQHGA